MGVSLIGAGDIRDGPEQAHGVGDKPLHSKYLPHLPVPTICPRR